MIGCTYLKPVRGTGDGGRGTGSSGAETQTKITLQVVILSGAEGRHPALKGGLRREGKLLLPVILHCSPQLSASAEATQQRR